MKFRFTILNIYAIIFIAGCLGFTLYNYEQLSEAEGWGLIGMVGLLGFGLLLIIADIVIHNIIKNNTIATITRLVVVFIATFLVIYREDI